MNFSVSHPEKDDIASLKKLWQEVFSDTDEYINAFFETVYSPKLALCAKADGQVIGMLYILECESRFGKIGYIYAVAVAPDRRGLGVAAEMLGDAVSLLKKEGFIGALTVPADSSLFELYKRHGFKNTVYHSEYTVTAADMSLPIKRLTAKQYLERRTEYLPIGGITEGAGIIKLLSLDTLLLGGDGFIAAINREGDTFLCYELLGNMPSADYGHLIFSVGGKNGVIRTVGTGHPFAVYYPFDGSPTPEYFGIALD